MRELKRFIGRFALAAICMGGRAEELTISEVKQIEISLVPAATNSRIFGAVGVSGTNGVFVWNQPTGEIPGRGVSNGFSRGNIFLCRLDTNGIPIEGSTRFAVAGFDSVSQPHLLPTLSGFFMTFQRISNFFNFPNPRVVELLLTRIGLDGRQVFEPRRLIEESYLKYDVASNGRTVMAVHQSYSSQTGDVNYRLFDGMGGIIATGAITGAVTNSFAVASDGTDYLLVWQSKLDSRVRATWFSGKDASNSTISPTDFAGSILSLGHGKNGYLLSTRSATYESRFFQLGSDGSAIASVSNQLFSDPSGSAIYGEENGWLLFAPSNQLVDLLRVAVDGSGAISQQVIPYPVSPARLPRGYSVWARDCLVPFGTGRLLIATDMGACLGTRTGATFPTQAKTDAHQFGGVVVGSPFGYLAVWREGDAEKSTLRGLRFAKDGTPLDAHSFPILNPGNYFEPPCVFDGTNYVLPARAFNGWPATVRIAPTGAPNMWFKAVALTNNFAGFRLVVNKGQVYESFEDTGTNATLHIYPVFATTLGPEAIVDGKSLVSDGDDLYSVGAVNGEVFVALIRPGENPLEVTRTSIAQGTNAFGVPLKSGFVAAWLDSNAQWSYAYFENGVERLRSDAPVPGKPQFAANNDLLLVAWPNSPSGDSYTFKSIKVATGETISRNVNFDSASSISIASAGEDFFGIADLLSQQKYYVGGFWITTSPAPTFGNATMNGSSARATLKLNPLRQYRIEISEDLVHWKEISAVNGVADAEIPIGAADKGFTRALLVPE